MHPEPSPSTAAEGPPSLRGVRMPSLPPLIDRLGVSLLITTYQAGELRREPLRTNP